ncbi:MarR family transcriptional regulator [Novosphingobium colocasiae]|uniref:MarR family transcriptional regulator n=1 Tax=Novosphingobium colocasiae TaxID=1256513 RepID=UPI0035B13DBD
MEHGDFAYGADAAAGAGRAAISIFANRAHVRDALRDDAVAAGARVQFAGSLADIADMPDRPLGDVVWLDCPLIDAQGLAVLARLDMRAAAGAIRLVVSTTVDALDDIYGWMDQSVPLLLVDPGRVDRVIALARVMAERPAGGGVRELSDDDRLMLMRLTEQVGVIAGRIEKLAPGGPAPAAAMPPPFADAGVGVGAGGRSAFFAADKDGPADLPEARLVRRIIRQRQLRARFFDGDLFADPAWDMLLDLAAARAEGVRVSVTSLCIASGVPPTTALRWIGQMVEGGLFTRACDDNDRRRAFIELSDRAVQAIAAYFREVALSGPVPV